MTNRNENQISARLTEDGGIIQEAKDGRITATIHLSPEQAQFVHEQLGLRIDRHKQFPINGAA
jgi:hypothetical protein